MAGFIGQSYKRKEDDRLLSGSAVFVADMRLLDMLEAAFVRSAYAHATIKHIDCSAALQCEGVYAVITAHDIQGKVGQLNPLEEFSLPQDLIDSIHPVLKACPEEILASERVVYVGQPVAVVLASNRYLAEDAVQLVNVDYEPLPVVHDPFAAKAADSPIVHPHMGGNVQAQFHLSVGNVQAALDTAEHVLKAHFVVPRVAGNPLETRGILASFDARTQQLQVWSSTQVPFMVRSAIAKLLGLVENNIRVIAPDMGGGFGAKCAVYPEEILLPYLAMQFGRPVKWIEDRLEHLLSTRHARDQIHDVEVAYTSDGMLLGVKDRFVVDNGAANPLLLTCPYNTAAHLKGLFKIPNYDILGECVITNKAPNIAYRGAGRPEAVFVMDRILSMVADALNKDPVDILLTNMIRPEEMPYDQGLFYRDGARVIYDSGDYPAALQQALDIIDYRGFRQQQEELRKQDEYIGIGFSSYIEGTGIGPYEGAIIRLDPTGQVIVDSGSCPHGQSHETVFAQICADMFGVTPEQITVRAGDTALIPRGIGTFASRGAVVSGSAVHIAAQKLRDKMLAIAGELLEANPLDLEMREGKVYLQASPGKAVTFKEIARAATPGPRCKVPYGMEPGLEVTHYFVPSTVTYSSGIHIATVKVDKETGFLEILRYIVVDDCGRVLNPMVVSGQIQGGVAQGIGEALYEQIMYDEEGQLLTGTFMDYLLPTALEVPRVELAHQHHQHLTTKNPLGIKGVGEAGPISPPAALANAVMDALKPFNVQVFELPLSPARIRQWIRQAERI